MPKQPPRSRKSLEGHMERTGVDPDEMVIPAERIARTATDRARAAFRPELIRADEEAGLRRPDDEVRTDARWAVQQQSGPWEIRWVVAPSGEGRAVRSLHIEPAGQQTPAGGITADMLRSLRPSAAAAWTASSSVETDSWAALWDRYVAERAAEPPASAPRRGRPALTDDHLARLAIAYLREQERGRGLHRRLAEEFDRTEPTIRDQVRAARQRGYLSDDAHPGRRGASPGPRLRDWLQDQEERS